MDTILTIFKSLEINQTLFYQLAIVIALYAILRNLLFSKLQEILELREEKTTKMEGGAHEKLNQAEKLSQEYKQKIDEARSEAFTIVTKKKDEVVARESGRAKEHEKKMELDFEAKRSEFATEVESKRSEIMQQADSLSQDLVNKIVQ